MAQQSMILCIDVGGDSIKAAEFSYTQGVGLTLERFAYTEYDYSPDDPSDQAIMAAVSKVITENKFTAKDVYITISGKSAFVRFVKIPAMTTDKNEIKNIVSLEAKQAVPLSPDEIVWDSQIMSQSSEDAAEIDAMIVIVKKDIVSHLSELIQGMHRRIVLIEVAGTSSFNAACANRIGSSECQLILDIGGSCTTMVFLEGSKFYIRSTPIGGDTITQQIAKEFNISYEDAENMKREHGYVALGGVYADDSDEIGSAVSKIARNVMTRLHGEIIRSVNLYRASQKGHKPEKIFLSGGCSILPYVQNFVEEKMSVPVEFFNPFQIVNIGTQVNQEILSQVAHLFSQVIGVALRRIGTSPIEISLVPEHIKKQIAFRKKSIFFYISAAVILSYLGITYWAFDQQAKDIESKKDEFSRFVTRKESIKKRVSDANTKLNNASYNFNGDDGATVLLRKRNNTIMFFEKFRQCVPSNVWFTELSLSSAPNSSVLTADSVVPDAAQDAAGGNKSRMRFNNEDDNAADGQKDEKQTTSATGELTWLNLTAYVICKRTNSKSNDRYAAFNILTSNLKKTKLFRDSDQEIQWVFVEDDVNTDSLSVSKFLLAIELKAPLDSPEFEAILSGRGDGEGESDEE